MSYMIQSIWGRLASAIGAALVGFVQGGVGAVLRTVQSKLMDLEIHVSDFGAVGNGIADDTNSIVKGLAYAQSKGRNLHFTPGAIYKITSRITLSGVPIGLIGEMLASHQQGSALPSVTLRWAGGGSQMFDLQSSGWTFVGFAVENRGTATDWMLVTGGQHCHFERLSFLPATGTTRFSRSVIHCPNNELGYSTFRAIHYQNVAPSFLSYDATGQSNGVTPLVFEGRCVFESNSLGPTTILRSKACTFDSVRWVDCTFNSNDLNELCVVDTTDTPNTVAIAALLFEGACEFDTSSSAATMRYLRLANCPNVQVVGAQIQGGGTATSFANMTASTATRFEGNFVERFAGPMFSCDASSRVYPGLNSWNTSNTQGVQNNVAGEFGQVLRGKAASLAVVQSTTAAAYANLPNLTATIKPSCSTSKVRINVNVTGVSVTAASTAVGFAIARNGVVIAEFEKEAGFTGSMTVQLSVGGASCTLIDEPASTADLTYTVQWRRIAGAGTCYVCASSSRSTMEVAEVAF